MTATVDIETNEGPIIQAKSIGKVYGPVDQDTNNWTIKGQPNISVQINQPKTAELTCATIVNRIPELMVANPGFMTTHNWPSPSYRGRALASYLTIK
jgi:4-hydroxy-tetrahydrodipicolinate reductase